MPSHAISSAVEAEDLIRGLALFGTGGGGLQEVGRRRLLPAIEAGKPIRWVDMSAIADDVWTCSGFGMGSIAPHKTLSREERAALGYGEVVAPQPLVQAIRELARYRGVRIEILVPSEIGAGNTTGPLYAAAMLGLAVVDGDYSGGRATPEMAVATPVLLGHGFHPAAICDPWGNLIFIEATPSIAVAERLGKAISTVTRLPDPLAQCAHAGFLLRAGEMRKCLVPGTITRAFEVGKSIRQARESGRDPVAAAAEAMKGWVLCRGIVTKREWQSNGYMIGTTTIEGVEGDRGRMLRLWHKNENLLSWLDNEPFVTAPDLLCVMDETSGEPYTNTVLAKGHRVAVLASRGADIYRTASGLQLMGPAHFGFDWPYRPVEKLMSQLLEDSRGANF